MESLERLGQGRRVAVEEAAQAVSSNYAAGTSKTPERFRQMQVPGAQPVARGPVPAATAAQE